MEDQEQREEQLQKKPMKRVIKYAIVVGSLAAVALLAYGILQIRTFSTFSTEKTQDVEGASESEFLLFNDNLLKYNNDGAIYSDLSDHIIWNETFEMANPTVKVSGSYLVIYDRQGTEIHVMTTAGAEGTVRTSLPITAVDVSSQGTVAILTQNGQKGHIELMDAKGNTLASGEVHFKNTGYPTAIAISPDSEKVMVSFLSVGDGKLATVINFYNFGSAGQQEIDNIVAAYTYEGTVIPEVDFSTSGRAVAFGTDRIILYDNGAKPKETKIVEPEGEIETIFYNNEYFGYVTLETDEETGEVGDYIEAYSYRGSHRVHQLIDSNYREISMLEDNEILVSDGRKVSLYNMYGVERFQYSFDNTIYGILPVRLQREYMVVYQDSIDYIKLR